MDLPLGKIRLRQKGSSGGQKGMGNIITLLKTDEIKRIRMGVGHDRTIETVDYVLGKFSKDEMVIFKESISEAKDALKYSFDHDFDQVMNRFN